jgi:hypothetical protein
MVADQAKLDLAQAKARQCPRDGHVAGGHQAMPPAYTSPCTRAIVGFGHS